MSLDVTIRAPMAPHPKGRPRAAVVGGAIKTYTPAVTRQWERAFATYANLALGRTVIDEPVRVDLLLVLPRPQRTPKSAHPGLLWAPVRPDRDNLEKAVLDALKSHWRDDSLVVCGESLKCYAEADGQPRVVCRIRSAGGDERADIRAAEMGLL